VVVALVAVRLVITAVTAFRSVAKRLDEVALVFIRLVIVAEAEVRSVIVPRVIVVVARVEVPVTVSDPPMFVLPDTVRAVAEAVESVVCPCTVRVDAVVVASIDVPVA
jgi:hypothetical protein